MKKNYLENRIYLSKYFYMLMMILWTAKSAPILKIDPGNPLAFIFYMVILCLYTITYAKGRFLSKSLLALFGTYAIWYVAVSIKYHSIQTPYFGLIINFYIVYLAFYIFKGKEFFHYVEKVLAHLCILSIIVWGLHNIFPYPFGQLMRSISVCEEHAIMKANIILVGIADSTAIKGLNITRNIGFTWEAGRFSCYLVFAIFINLCLHRFRISFKYNQYLLIFLIGLITTFSTTGFMAMTAVIMLWAYNKSFKYKIAIFVIGCFLLPVIWGLSFVGGKITDSLNYKQEITDMKWMFDHGDKIITPQRITGIYLEIQNLIHDFWLGYCVNENSYTVKKIFSGHEVWLSNGFIQILSMYGVLYGSFFYYWLFKSSYVLCRVLHYKGGLLFAIMFLLMSVSYELWTLSIMQYCIFYAFFMMYKR